MSRPSLPQVTLCAVDARCPALAVQALRRSMQHAAFGRVVLFTQGFASPVESIEVVDVGPIRSGAEYSRFVLRELPARIDTEFVLITQWDGFAIDASAWSDDFLAYDYIGAVWDDQVPSLSVGNGGFSLRSQRMLQAGMDSRIAEYHPEDVALCRTYRALLEHEYGIRIAPAVLAQRFAYENRTPGCTFGFHGPKNLPRVLDQATLRNWLSQLPDDFFRGRDARRLMRALVIYAMSDVAGVVARRRLSVGRSDFSTRLVAELAPALRYLDRLR